MESIVLSDAVLTYHREEFITKEKWIEKMVNRMSFRETGNLIFQKIFLRSFVEKKQKQIKIKTVGSLYINNFFFYVSHS